MIALKTAITQHFFQARPIVRVPKIGHLDILAVIYRVTACTGFAQVKQQDFVGARKSIAQLAFDKLVECRCFIPRQLRRSGHHQNITDYQSVIRRIVVPFAQCTDDYTSPQRVPYQIDSFNVGMMFKQIAVELLE